MASELEQEFERILSAAQPAQEVKLEESLAEVKENSEVEGVETAAIISSEENAESEPEGQEPSDELDEELKNIDPELREALSKVDAEVKKAQINAFKKMRASFDKKQTEFGQEKKLAETAKQLFQKHGIDPVNGFSQVEKLINLGKELERDPKRVVNLLKQKFNLQDEKSGSELDESLLTDEERLIYNKQKNIEKTVESLVEENRRLKEDREKEEIARATLEISKFAQAKNEDGSLQNPHFEDLMPEIGRLTALYPNDNIASLYNKALRLNDDIYNKSLEDVKEKERKRTLSDKEAALKKAKSINSQSLKASSKVTEPVTLDDILSDIYDRSLSN